MEPTVAEGCSGGLRVLVIAEKEAGAAREDLALLGDAHLGRLDRLADALRIDVAIAVDDGKAGDLGLAVDLLQVHADRAEEAEAVGPERRSARVGPPQLAEAELVAKGVEHQSLGQRVLQPQR